MLDLGTSFLASVARDPEALAIVDGAVRLSYSAWYGKISGLVAGLDALGLKPGDHLLTVLQNRWEAATLHWACQFAGIIITPLNWRSTAEELDFCLQDAEAKAIVYDEVSAAVKQDATAAGMTVTDEVSYAADATDLTPTLSNVRKTNPDVLVIADNGATSVTAFKQIKELGWKVPITAQLGNILPSSFKLIGADDLAGVVSNAFATMDPNVDLPAAQKAALARLVRLSPYLLPVPSSPGPARPVPVVSLLMAPRSNLPASEPVSRVLRTEFRANVVRIGRWSRRLAIAAGVLTAVTTVVWLELVVVARG